MTAYALERPVLAVDVVIFTVRDSHLQVLLLRRDEEPFAGAWTLPGVAVRVDETLESAARRALLEKVGWPAETGAAPYLEQLATFDALFRDPRGRTVSVAYVGLTRRDCAAEAVRWQAAADLQPHDLPFDHGEIVHAALTRVQGKFRYTNMARALLPDTFRIEELQAVYEAVLGRRLNRTNFRMKLLKIGIIEQVSILADAVGSRGGRPPHVYRFTQGLVETVDRDFL